MRAEELPVPSWNWWLCAAGGALSSCPAPSTALALGCSFPGFDPFPMRSSGCSPAPQLAQHCRHSRSPVGREHLAAPGAALSPAGEALLGPCPKKWQIYTVGKGLRLGRVLRSLGEMWDLISLLVPNPGHELGFWKEDGAHGQGKVSPRAGLSLPGCASGTVHGQLQTFHVVL